MLQIDEDAIRKIFLSSMKTLLKSFIDVIDDKIKDDESKDDCECESDIRCKERIRQNWIRKRRNDIGIPRNTGNGTTVFYTPDLCRILHLKDCRYVHYQVKRFNAVSKDKISMPGSAKTGYRASHDAWRRFFLMCGETSI